MSSAPPAPGTLTSSAFTQLLRLYPELQIAAYKAKAKDPKKLAAAQKDHDWRYDELPRIIAERSHKPSSAYLEKDEMVRLTQWKIVHGQHRPFLPGMVKKNNPERVKEVTVSAFEMQAGANYSGSGLPDTLDKALREAAQLHGVGPATATLVCSLLDPTNVAFFEDELAEWLLPNVPKLKYTWAEYKALYSEIMKLRMRLGLKHRAVDVEKVGFVVRHLDLLDEKQREALKTGNETDGDDEYLIAPESKSPLPPFNLSSDDDGTQKTSKSKASTTKRKIKVEDVLPKDEGKPKSKRRKKE